MLINRMEAKRTKGYMILMLLRFQVVSHPTFLIIRTTNFLNYKHLEQKVVLFLQLMILIMFSTLSQSNNLIVKSTYRKKTKSFDIRTWTFYSEPNRSKLKNLGKKQNNDDQVSKLSLKIQLFFFIKFLFQILSFH